MTPPGYPPLVNGAEGLERRPAPPDALRARMAELYGVPANQVLPTRGATHALELVLRSARASGRPSVGGEGEWLTRLASIYGYSVEAGARLRVMSSPDERTGAVLSAAGAEALAGEVDLLVVDESAIEFADSPSLAPLTGRVRNLVVLRSLSLAYQLAGAPCGAAVANPVQIDRLRSVLEPDPLPTPIVRLAEAVLSPSRALATEARIAAVRTERARMAEALRSGSGVEEVIAGEAPWVWVRIDGEPKFARYGVSAQACADGWRVPVGTPEANARTLAAFGVVTHTASGARRGEAVRDTKETRIVASVDLDRSAGTTVRTGVGFYDHMLEQVAAHGGFSLRLACEGDLQTDPHHTVEDSALALGAALKQALGDKAGIGRYGFTAPMDEAEAQVSLDLSGRPYCVFEGDFRAERLGEYPTALTAHVFRSLADSLGAAIHVRVRGEDDHHKTEVCFKAFGRALRQAIRREGGAGADEVPSTKGVL